MNSKGQQMNSKGHQMNSNGHQMNSKGHHMNSKGPHMNSKGHQCIWCNVVSLDNTLHYMYMYVCYWKNTLNNCKK